LFGLRELPLLGEIRIPLWLREIEEIAVNCSLHIFCDASKAAFAASVFVCTEYSTCVRVQMVQTISRVSPLKQLTIPTLELLAATIGARLVVSVKNQIEQGEPSHFFWSDSSTIIAWIQRGHMERLRMELDTGHTKFDGVRGLAPCAGCHEYC
jgi:hypothetical protein